MIVPGVPSSSADAQETARKGWTRRNGGVFARVCAWVKRLFARSRGKSPAAPSQLSRKSMPAAARRERARLSLGRSIVQAYCTAILLFVVSGCWLAAGSGGEERLKGLLAFAQALGAVFNPVVGFVIGYYFARREG